MRSKAYRTSMVDSNVTLRIATQIRLLRERAQLSQAQLADCIGTRQSAIARIESGQYGKFSISLLHRIANYFNVAIWVEFVSFSTLLRRTADLSPQTLTPASYDDEFREDGEPLKNSCELSPRTKNIRTIPYSTPGKILLEEFLKPMGITQYRVAKEIGVPQRRIGEIVAGKRAITADTGLRLSRYFGMSDEFWTGLQLSYDQAKSKDALADVLEKIRPLEHA